MKNEIVITSKTIEQKYLQSCTMLVAAFFPSKNIKILSCQKALEERTLDDIFESIQDSFSKKKSKISYESVNNCGSKTTVYEDCSSILTIELFGTELQTSSEQLPTDTYLTSFTNLYSSTDLNSSANSYSSTDLNSSANSYSSTNLYFPTDLCSSGTDSYALNIEKHTKPQYPVFEFYWNNSKGLMLNDRINPPALLETWELPLPGQESVFQILLKRAVCLFANKINMQSLPWGTLTGIRPGKLIYRMRELGYSHEQRASLLQALYLAEQEKIALLEGIAQIQEPYLETMIVNPRLVSIYISIPFCPTRCYYCSFPSHLSKEKNTDIIEKYLQVLHEEIGQNGALMREFGLIADSIYIGGGTPTILGHAQLNDLLATVAASIPTVKHPEYTVEAGRPDTIDLEKLTLMKNYFVNRISINPQSMQADTLKRIGRQHTTTDVIDRYNEARTLSDWTINMDLILGLQGESSAEVRDSIDQVLNLKPDNITIHALAMKRGSDAWQDLSRSQQTPLYFWQDIQSEVHQKLLGSGYYPYYLYRQKYIAGNLENIGYTIAGRESRYNIAVIEEKQDILGLGAGASSKVLHRRAKIHRNIYHSTDVNHYLTHYQEVFAERELLLRQDRS